MPSIWSFSKGAVTGMDLGANAFWRLKAGANGGTAWYIGLVLIYPPVPPLSAEQTQIMLARTAVPMANSYDDVKRIAEVLFEGGDPELDKKRVEEVFNMFKYGDSAAKLKGDVLPATIKDAGTVVDLYWNIRNWLAGGCLEKQEFTNVADFKVVCRP
jgi:hypothetical protein